MNATREFVRSGIIDRVLCVITDIRKGDEILLLRSDEANKSNGGIEEEETRGQTMPSHLSDFERMERRKQTKCHIPPIKKQFFNQ